MKDEKACRARRVEKALPPPASAEGSLRSDLTDLCSLTHRSLALPVSLERRPGAGSSCLVRPYVEGTDLRSAVRGEGAVRGRGPAEVIRWLIAAAQPLEILHRFGFLHRN